MKITTEHYDAMASMIEPLDTASLRASYRAGEFPRASAVKDLDRRYRWDLFWASGAISPIADAGYADAHIDTALRRIVSPL